MYKNKEQHLRNLSMTNSVGSAHCVNRRVYSSRRISKFLSDTTAFTAIIWNQYLYEEAWIRIG